MKCFVTTRHWRTVQVLVCLISLVAGGSAQGLPAQEAGSPPVMLPLGMRDPVRLSRVEPLIFMRTVPQRVEIDQWEYELDNQGDVTRHATTGLVEATFGADGRLVSESVLYDAGVEVRNYSYEAGVLKRTTTRRDWTGAQLSFHYGYSYEGRTTVITKSDAAGTLVSIEEQHYDENDRLVINQLIDESGRGERWEFDYGERDNTVVTRALYFRLRNSKPELRDIYEIERDRDRGGNIVRLSRTNRDGEETWRREYQYSDSGQVSSYMAFARGAELGVYQFEYNFDDHGNWDYCLVRFDNRQIGRTFPTEEWRRRALY